ncbi:MAG: UDPGP type 1 family protein [Planctomycetes bacterium]|nr:UDPGP type 1 family protein [Planctomycetota bacterium]
MPKQPLDEQAIRHRVEKAGQGHVFRFWKDLPQDGRKQLLANLAEVDFAELAALVREHVIEHRPLELPPDLEPAPFIPLPRTGEDHAQRRRMHQRGEKLIAAGTVAAFVVAGGQGTRLGFKAPKGEFVIGPVSERPLFQVLAEAILATRRAYDAAIPWYIMTSHVTDQETRDFFKAHKYFDLPRADVKFFSQGKVPAVDFQGQLLLAARDGLAWNPDGHGGSIQAMARSGMLADMAARGIETISYFQVDNPLVPPIDPVFIGCHAEAHSEMSSKMVRKRDAAEKVGHFCLSGGRLHVIEYSDLEKSGEGRKILEARNPDGSLRFGAGSIAIHILQRKFIERLNSDARFALPFHQARKKIPYVDESGVRREPQEPNGIKFETFVFDALPMAERPVVLEIDRAAEFSPVKNAEGDDTPATARRDMMRLAARWLQEAGVAVPRDDAGDPKFKIEISPLAARNVQELKALVARLGLHEVTGDLYLGPETA